MTAQGIRRYTHCLLLFAAMNGATEMQREERKTSTGKQRVTKRKNEEKEKREEEERGSRSL